MKFTELALSGVWLVEPAPFRDERGALLRHYCQREFKDGGLNETVCQTNLSQNPRRHTLRGFHYQLKPFEEAKTMSCMRGRIYDVVVDLRRDSPTFLRWLAVELDADSGQQLQIPAGCANAYITLEDNTWIFYYMSQFYEPGSYRGFRYNDPVFAISWPHGPALISDKDRDFPDFDPQRFDL